MNTLSDNFCVISIVSAAVAVDWDDGVDGAVAVADDVFAAAAADGHAVVTYHRVSSFRNIHSFYIDRWFFSLLLLFLVFLFFVFLFNGQLFSIFYAHTIYQHSVVRFSIELIMATE